MTTTPPPPPDQGPEPQRRWPGVVPPRFDSRAFDERGQRFGREAQEAADRLSRNPSVVGFADLTSRVWGVIVLAIGLWFFADYTLGYDLPSVAWADLWPLILIVLGLAVVVTGLSRRKP